MILNQLHRQIRFLLLNPSYRSTTCAGWRRLSTPASLDAKTIEERVLNVLKHFDKVDPSKVSLIKTEIL
jgi:hypothetical protein